MKKILLTLLIVSTLGLAKLEKIDDNYYRLTSENVREIAVVKAERDYFEKRNRWSNIKSFAYGFLTSKIIYIILL